MKPDYDPSPDDLRLRFCACSQFVWEQPPRTPMFSLPYTVLFFLLRGKSKLVFADRGRPPLVSAVGEVHILPANLRRQPFQLALPAEILAVGYSFEIRGGMDLMNFYDFPAHFTPATDGRLRELMEELRDAEAQAAEGPEMQTAATRQRIGYALLETLLPTASPKPGLLPVRRILPAIEILNEKYREPPDFEGLVAASGFSRTHFFRAFKSQTGFTPGEYLKRRRLREAALLLQQSDLTVAQVGAAVGWPDQFYFSKLFKAALGLAPTAYRQRYRSYC